MNAWKKYERERQREARPYVGNAPLSLFFLPHDQQFYYCAKCDVRKPRSEFEVGKRRGLRGLSRWCKDCRLKHPSHVTDGYASHLIRQGTGLPFTAPVPKHLIELKRRQIQLMRLRKEHENK
jgi:hypothetical protein